MNRPLSLTSLWVWHTVFCALALLSSVPILWPQVFLPDAWEADIISYAGWALLLSFGASLVLIAATAFLLLLRLRNLRTLGYLVIWALEWGVAIFLFCLLAWVADVPLPGSEAVDSEPIQRTDRLFIPEESLTGPDSLEIPITLEPYPADSIVHALNLTLLDEKHNALLRAYIDASPRWASYTGDDTFYTKPGHVVMTPPRVDGITGLVHVAFRRLVEGDPMPAGYTIVKPGDPMPGMPQDSEQVADLAVDLGGSHYLLLAWRGTSHTETAHRALNAALATVNDMLAWLAEKPEPATVQHLLTGKRNIRGATPEILLNQPPSQYGAYQAEVYANPGEPGTLMLRIVNLEDGATLRLFSCPAQFSTDPGELFRHDYPGLMRAYSVGHVPGLLPEKAPLFIMRLGEPHQFFGVACEVVFEPVAPNKQARILLRRCYRVQAYEDPSPTQNQPEDATSPPAGQGEPEPPAATEPPTDEPPAPTREPSAAEPQAADHTPEPAPPAEPQSPLCESAEHILPIYTEQAEPETHPEFRHLCPACLQPTLH